MAREDYYVSATLWPLVCISLPWLEKTCTLQPHFGPCLYSNAMAREDYYLPATLWPLVCTAMPCLDKIITFQPHFGPLYV